MKLKMLAVAVLVGLLGAIALAGEQPNTYQITAPITAMTADVITVKPRDPALGASWQIGRDAKTKMTGTPKIGDTVTITYRMFASAIEVKPPK